ncbi:hypothetical protein [Legionella wadsworthii]|uniref:hypothetical protein n=1 Tax=Legionella wadsworthii TaxID=28088 RepID=UPI0010559E2F|nr:hypothetical protein [Legionella wadsworthii]
MAQNLESQNQVKLVSKEEREVISEAFRNSNFSPSFFTSTLSSRESRNTQATCVDKESVRPFP